MIKSYTKILGTPVLLDSIRPLTTVKDLIIDPESGKVIAFMVNQSRKEIIVPIDVQGWHEILKIRDRNAVIEVADVLRVEEVMKSGRFFYGAKVYTKDAEYLGKILDFAVNTKSYMIESIFVAKSILGLVQYDSRIIKSTDIVEVKRGIVVVKENTKTIKEEERDSLPIGDAVAG